MHFQLIISVLSGIACLLLLILYFRLPAFISLLIASIVSGLIAGLAGDKIISTIQEGMGSTLGFVATIVGLGAMFGAILEKSGGAVAIANHLIKKFGEKNAPLSLAITGLMIAIPVFFEVAFILLVPILYAIQKKTGKSLLLYAMPLLSGLAFGHAFIPPTPGPIAVAQIIGADLGWVILAGVLIGIPTVLVSGIIFGKFIAKKIHIQAPILAEDGQANHLLPTPAIIFSILFLPIALILFNTIIKTGVIAVTDKRILDIISLVGHPFGALILANIIAWYVLGIRRGFTKNQLFDITVKSLAPAGNIILLIGAGGVFKQVLVNTGAGKMLAESLTGVGLPLVVFAFIAAAIIRILQGSATVAMITSAGLVAPLIVGHTFSGMQLAAIVTSISSGASIMSHVNDAGFWLVKQYLGLTEKQTFRSWTMMITWLSLVGFLFSLLIFFCFS
ncbi:MAG: gluconate:H+ symporter [Ferruginibacter sp.]